MVKVMCPHLDRLVLARKNTLTELFVQCSARDACVSLQAPPEGGEPLPAYPACCPVYRRQVV
jgi:hypothetical protein